MKPKYLLLSFLALATFAFTGCNDEVEIVSLSEFKASPSYIGFALEGGTLTSDVTATATWAFDKETLPSWLTVSPESGDAGALKINFTAAANNSTKRSAEVKVKIGDRTQIFTVTQDGKEAPLSTIAEVLAGADGASYKVKGAVTGIASTSYGNLYINDGTGSILVYGLKNKSGQYPKDAAGGWASFGIDPGDEITIQGPKIDYSGTKEFKDATLISVLKSLVAVSPDSFELEKESSDFVVAVFYKGTNLEVVPSEDWLSVKSLEKKDDSTYVTLHAVENTGVTPRTATVSFTSALDKQTSTVRTSVKQKGNEPVLSTIEDALKTTFAHVEGSVMAMSTKGYVLSDATGSIFAFEGNTKFKPGDKVKVVGAIGAYNFGVQIGHDVEEKLGHKDPVYPDPVELTAAKLDEIIASKGTDKTKVEDAIKIQYVRFTGTVSISGKYTNILIAGSANDVSPYNATSDFKFTDGATVTCTGYAIAVSGSKHLNVVLASLE